MTQDIQKEIANILRQLIDTYHAQRVFLFGSAANDSFGPDSDLDFLVVKEDVPESGPARARQVRTLVAKRLPADFLVFRPSELEERLRLGDPFLRDVIAKGRLLYG